MHSTSANSVKWFLLAAVLAGSGFAAFVGPHVLRQRFQRNPLSLDDSPLVGYWLQQGDAARYRINVTPSVIFVSSFDEADICEIEVLQNDARSHGGILQGVVRLHRTNYRNLPCEGKQGKIYYELRDKVLKLSWDEWLELSPRHAQHQLDAKRGHLQFAVNSPH